MDRKTLTPSQVAALLLMQRTEPMPRGIVLADTLGRDSLLAFAPIEPSDPFPQGLAAALEPLRRMPRLIMLVVNDHSLEAAQRDSEAAHGEFAAFPIEHTVLVSGATMLDTDRIDFSDLPATIQSLPRVLRDDVSPLRAWAPTRERQFDGVDAAHVCQVEELMDQWGHLLVTGELPSPELVQQLAAAMGDGRIATGLLAAVAHLAFPSLDENASVGDAVRALLTCTERPRNNVMLHGGLALCFAGLHSSAPTDSAWLYATGALLLWGAGRAKSGMIAVETALMYDPTAGPVAMAYQIISTHPRPGWAES